MGLTVFLFTKGIKKEDIELWTISVGFCAYLGHIWKHQKDLYDVVQSLKLHNILNNIWWTEKEDFIFFKGIFVVQKL